MLMKRTILHETGHAIGLYYHSDDSKAIMYAVQPNEASEKKELATSNEGNYPILTKTDVIMLKNKYPLLF